jgi:hypothetical protein
VDDLVRLFTFYKTVWTFPMPGPPYKTKARPQESPHSFVRLRYFYSPDLNSWGQDWLEFPAYLFGLIKPNIT